MSDMFKGDRERIALGVAPAVETLRLSRCTFTMGADAVPATVDAKAVGHSLRMAVVVAEAQRRFQDSGGKDSATYWARVWGEKLAPDVRHDFDDAWIAVRVGERAWSDAAPKRYARVTAAVETGADHLDHDVRPAFEMTETEDAACCLLFDRGLAAETALRFDMNPRLGRVLRNDALAFSANLLDLANLAGQVLRTAAEDGSDARFFDLLTRKRRTRERLRRRMRVLQRRALAAEKAYSVVFAPERPALLKLAEFDELSTADFMRVAARMLGLDVAPRRIVQVATPAPSRIAAAPAAGLRAAS